MRTIDLFIEDFTNTKDDQWIKITEHCNMIAYGVLQDIPQEIWQLFEYIRYNPQLLFSHLRSRPSVGLRHNHMIIAFDRALHLSFYVIENVVVCKITKGQNVRQCTFSGNNTYTIEEKLKILIQHMMR